MRRSLAFVTALVLAAWAAAPARAGEAGGSRDIEQAVARYVGAPDDPLPTGAARVVGGPGSAGYDRGFWIQGGGYALRIDLILQARYEAWLWDGDEEPLDPYFGGGDLSGFSLPRATVKLSGRAPCKTSYYAHLAFGHPGRDEIERRYGSPVAGPLGPLVQSGNYDVLREAWLEWSPSDLLNLRMGLIPTAATRQLMTPPELQQFADVSLASAFLGSLMPGYTDRNRDHGVALHGHLGDPIGLGYLFTLTNGDGGDGVRNVLDGRSSDNFAFSGRLNWAFLDPLGYQEGALAQMTCETYGEVGAWAYYYADRADLPHRRITDALRWGVDLALGYGGLSFTGAASFGSDEDETGADVDYAAYLLQLGYHFPGTPWEIAARWSMYDVDNPAPALTSPAGQQHPLGDGAVREIALALNYYLNGHGNKLSLDVALLSGRDPGSALLFDPYTGLPGSANATGAGEDTYGLLLRFQWQLAL